MSEMVDRAIKYIDSLSPEELVLLFKSFGLEAVTKRNDIRLVLEYAESDGYTYCYTRTVPIMYESAEALIVDFEEKCIGSRTNGELKFTIGGIEFNTSNFFDDDGEYDEPVIRTVDEWFEKVETQGV
jgi:hypothetical protein